MAGITIGPFSLPAGLVVALCGAVLALLARNLAAGAERARAERLLWMVLGAAALAARAVFVGRYWHAYAAAPLQAFDIRDGGVDVGAGMAAAIAAAAWLGWRNRAVRMPVLAGALAATLAWTAGLAIVSPAGTAQGIPAVTLPKVAGGAVDLRAFAGRPLVVNLWASWCPPCRREMPALAQAQRANPGTTFVFVNQGETVEAVRRYLGEHGLVLDNVLLDADARVAHAAGSPGLPTTLFFDAHGRLVERRMGELSAATLAQRLAAIRGPATP